MMIQEQLSESTQDQGFEVKWFHQFRFKAIGFVLALFLIIVLVTTAFMTWSGSQLVEDHAHVQLNHAGEMVLSELTMRTTMAETLVKALADIAENMVGKTNDLNAILPRMLDRNSDAKFIAGGGVWPEPYAFDPQKERNSLFWGRNEAGNLVFFDDYNRAEGKGYHQEEWYVPTKFVPKDKVYWSKSYIDPYSKQPMVTVSAPMYKGQTYLGVATIDLKLEGLQQLLSAATQPFGGYVFAVDRNGYFLAFPDAGMAQLLQKQILSGEARPFATINELAMVNANYQPYVQQLRHQEENIQHSEKITKLGKYLAATSYQLSPLEAQLAARHVLDEPSQQELSDPIHKYFDIELDDVLAEPALALITHMPETHWNIVTVMSSSQVTATMREQVQNLYGFILIGLFVTLFVAWFLLHIKFTRPLHNLTEQLKQSTHNKDRAEVYIDSDKINEFGALAHWFNVRTEELLQSREQVHHLALFDPLTRLPNRRLLNERLNQALSSARHNGTAGAVMFFDLDHFKNLNDSLGHDVGDQILIQVSQRVSRSIRPEDFVARLGGDEFVVIVPDNNAAEHDATAVPRAIVAKLLGEFAYPFEITGSQYHISTSVGIALYDRSEVSAKDILKQADTAMYQAKARGRNGYCFFEPTMQVRVDERFNLERELRIAIKNDALTLVYQPQVTATNHCRRLEVLARWQHPTLGMIPPRKFISVAEDSMLILELGDWVLNQACRQILQWETSAVDVEALSVNISPRQIQQPNFVANALRILAAHHVPPQKIMFEITESVIIANPDDVIAKMLELKKHGIKVSIDDFGTGYSSLAYLKKLPFDELKIDRSFVMDIEQSANHAIIAQTIFTMANNFGFDVIAEGVETQAEYQTLLDIGIRNFQGYLFSHPLAPADVEIYFREQHIEKHQLHII